MTNERIIELQKKMQKKQSSTRYLHTLGVQYTSVCLAMLYGCPTEKAELAGLLHDCAKHLSGEKLLCKATEFGVEISGIEANQPYLLHGKIGSIYAQAKYGIDDPDILNAIQNHTTGRPDMTLLEKIVFVADYIEPSRKKAPNLEILRKEAFTDLDSAVLHILSQTLAYLKTSGCTIDSQTEITFNYYEQLIRSRENEQR